MISSGDGTTIDGDGTTVGAPQQSLINFRRSAQLHKLI
jgi:hypothetical protein